jgi:nitrogen-specific signal transduction histidine kinase
MQHLNTSALKELKHQAEFSRLMDSKARVAKIQRAIKREQQVATSSVRLDPIKNKSILDLMTAGVKFKDWQLAAKARRERAQRELQAAKKHEKEQQRKEQSKIALNKKWNDHGNI